MKATVDLADLLGLHLVMSRNAGKGEYKIMVAAMGWATAELVMSRLAGTLLMRKKHSTPLLLNNTKCNAFSLCLIVVPQVSSSLGWSTRD